MHTAEICLLKERLLSKITPRFGAESVGEMLVEQKEIEDEMIFLRVAYKKIISFRRTDRQTIGNKP